MSALLRIWPLLLTFFLNLQSNGETAHKLAVMGWSCLAVALSLLYYLMTQNAGTHARSRRTRLGVLR